MRSSHTTKLPVFQIKVRTSAVPFRVLLDGSKWEKKGRWFIFTSASMRKSEDSHKGAEGCGAEELMGFLSTPPYQIMTPTSKDGGK